MRFDDMIATVLAQASDRTDRRDARWRQLVDLLAQRRQAADAVTVGRAYAFLRATRENVDPAVRRQAASQLAGRRIDPELLLFFAEDRPAIAAELIAEARLASADWLALLPRLSPPARALLRHRTDLGDEVNGALRALGPGDLVLESGIAPAAIVPGPAMSGVESESQIRELVARIEAYRRQKGEAAPAVPRPAPNQADAFRWETGTDGVLLWVEGVSRAALIGQSIAAIAGPGQFGVDGQAAGGFEKRAPFRDARLSVAGSGAASGDWRISGVPFFDPRRGAFLGYRGTARRPRPDEVARSDISPSAGLFGTAIPADSLRQLIHELRTPLNAILGFAEMIEGQYMGPAALAYRGQASGIIGQARGLLNAVDDLDTAARIETSRLTLDESPVDAAALLCRLNQSYEHLAAERGLRLAISIAEGLPPARVELAAAERMIARLLAGTIGLARPGETIAAAMTTANIAGKAMIQLAIDRPRAVAGLDEAALLDPGYSPEGDWPGAPALGLGFALRLVRNLAEAGGGALVVDARRFSLYLPAEATAQQAPGEGTA